jgi:hypothetical protein
MTINKLSKIQQVKVIKDRSNREWRTQRQGYDSRSSFLFRGSMSMLEGCGCHKVLTNATKAHPIRRCKLSPQRPSSLSTKGLVKKEPAFTSLGHASTTIWKLPRTTQCYQTTSRQFIKYTNQGLGFQGIPRHKSLKQMRGENESLQ